MTALELLLAQVAYAHGNLLAVFADLSEGDAHREPGGRAFSPAANFAHAVNIEDFFVNRVFRERAPLYETQATGISAPVPPITETWPDDHSAWARAVRVDPPAARAHAQEVFAATEAWVGSLTSADLERKVDLTLIGIPELPLWSALNMLVISHGQNLAGEMSAGKGVLGLRGYRF